MSFKKCPLLGRKLKRIFPLKILSSIVINDNESLRSCCKLIKILKNKIRYSKSDLQFQESTALVLYIIVIRGCISKLHIKCTLFYSVKSSKEIFNFILLKSSFVNACDNRITRLQNGVVLT